MSNKTLFFLVYVIFVQILTTVSNSKINLDSKVVSKSTVKKENCDNSEPNIQEKVDPNGELEFKTLVKDATTDKPITEFGKIISMDVYLFDYTKGTKYMGSIDEKGVFSITSGTTKIPKSDKYIINVKNVVLEGGKKYVDFIHEQPIKININVQSREVNILLSEKLTASNKYRAVLTWNGELTDVDSFLHCPWKKSDSDDEQIFHNNMNSINGKAKMDVDHRDGYGPETHTWTNDIKEDEEFTYVVNNYSTSEGYLHLANAIVRVYNGDKLIHKIHFPKDNKNVNTWYVFSLNGKNELQLINEFL